MLAPRSYTREDVVELHTHGGAVCAARAMAACLAAGARRARAGEFTLRAFLSGRLDLAQARRRRARRARRMQRAAVRAQHSSRCHDPTAWGTSVFRPACPHTLAQKQSVHISMNVPGVTSTLPHPSPRPRPALRQAESVAALVGARTAAAADSALAGLSGGAGAAVAGMRAAALALLAEIEAGLDFEDELPEARPPRAASPPQRAAVVTRPGQKRSACKASLPCAYEHAGRSCCRA